MDEVSPSTLWETFKVVIRGEIISYSSYTNKLKNAKLQQLIDSIAKVDRDVSLTPSEELFKKRVEVKAQYDQFSIERTQQYLLWSKGNLYEHGEKAGRLLAHQIKCQSTSRPIPQIRNRSQKLTMDPKEINDTFKEYYTNLYSSEFPEDTSNMLMFLDGLNIPKMYLEQKENLEQPINLQEVIDSINAMQSSKTSGPVAHKIAPLLLKMFTNSLENLKLPQTLTEAFITRILKPGKDPSMCSSYRPISLLNVDVKILAKILAFRIDSLIPEIISPDQTGFVKGRYSYTNLRRLLGVLYSPASRETPEVVVSLDADKAFDRVEWGYLFLILKRFGFGSKYVNWIQLIYSTPKVSVITNKVRSQFFPILRGTRQGCPLNPLLFALAKEPLSIMLKSLQSIKGIDRMGIEHRVSLYADDMLLYISNPVENVPKIVQNLSAFSNFSGFFNFIFQKFMLSH